ncbi:protein PET100 homolog, mitochondrial-like [Halichondria panicea]|uniref:protein PET100 homolog, mitochondrial-like n=1 Tax=Halichondria panicea TaxID=6063 RepID=UPI00312B5ED4
MGSGLELVRISIYVFFPVVLFYYFNRPDVYKKTISEKKKVIYPEGNRVPLSIEDNLKLREQMRNKRRIQAFKTS